MQIRTSPQDASWACSDLLPGLGLPCLEAKQLSYEQDNKTPRLFRLEKQKLEGLGPYQHCGLPSVDWAHSKTVILLKLNYAFLLLHLVAFQSSPVGKRMEERKKSIWSYWPALLQTLIWWKAIPRGVYNWQGAHTLGLQHPKGTSTVLGGNKLSFYSLLSLVFLTKWTLQTVKYHSARYICRSKEQQIFPPSSCLGATLILTGLQELPQTKPLNVVLRGLRGKNLFILFLLVI